MVFEGSGVYLNEVSFQFQMNNIGRAICEFEMDFKKSSFWLSNVSTDDVISVFVKGLKTGVEKDFFLSEPHQKASKGVGHRQEGKKEGD